MGYRQCADDVTQETYLSAFTALPRLSHDEDVAQGCQLR